ncbi:hypothetical protein AXG93_215s1250 [Marchantia polymorpha subsp. ruderalis]|uniref:Tubulin/FtsZ GTPase domain-containing protein n=1 Tax=Marchantia polymorpha subsp. ruderalis TaxID=1480154 RepID=A0A176W192_MARPO|nr:hypothetical protein AXG93_215s1250 [Marchantia polymorpha subsp. ruderalis]
MPRECITIQAGQCGNQVGCKFWESALREHAAAASGTRYPAFDDALSSFFRNVDTRYTPPREIKAGNCSVPIQCLKARAVLIDMEEGVVNQLLKGPLSELFDEKQYITDNSGSGNNWAQGHEFYGPKYSDAILEKVRHEVNTPEVGFKLVDSLLNVAKISQSDVSLSPEEARAFNQSVVRMIVMLQAESCHSLQSFFMLHSLGGGTGSGVGSYVLELLNVKPQMDMYPKVHRFCTSIFPNAEDDDVITSPYNSLLSMAVLAEHADCVLPLENQALLDIIQKKESWDAKAEAGQRLPTSRGGSKVRPGKPFDEMNGIAANLLLHLTSSMRFEGTLNVDLNEITTNLVPFPRLHFLVSSMAPYSSSLLSGSLEYGRFQDWFVQSASSRHAMFPPLSRQQHMHREPVCNDERELQQAVQEEILRPPLHSIHGHWGL